MTESQTRIERRGGERRRELLAIGRRLFAERPYDQLSMDDLAAGAGVAKGLLYYYFASKRGYYVAVVEDVAAEVREVAAADAGLPPLARLRRTVDAYLGFAQASPEAWRAFTAGGIGFDPDVRRIHDRERETLRELILGAVSPGARPRPALRAAVEGWLSFTEGAALEWLERGGMERAQVTELLVAALAGALAAAQAADPGVKIRPLE